MLVAPISENTRRQRTHYGGEWVRSDRRQTEGDREHLSSTACQHPQTANLGIFECETNLIEIMYCWGTRPQNQLSTAHKQEHKSGNPSLMNTPSTQPPNLSIPDMPLPIHNVVYLWRLLLAGGMTEKKSQACVTYLPSLGYFQHSQPCTFLPSPFWP